MLDTQNQTAPVPGQRNRRPFWKRADVWLLAAVLLPAALLLAGLALFGGKGDRAVVTRDGEPYGEYLLSADQSVDIAAADGRVTNRLVIEKGQARMEWADCPDQICVEHAVISKGGQSIVCLPNRVTVEIRSDKGNGIDGVAQ